MKPRAIALSLALFLSQGLFAASPTPSPEPAQKRVKPEIMSLTDVHRGQRGVAYTVFEGTRPEPMHVEVLGVLHDFNGPKSDIILARLHGAKVEYTGIVAGMSGSPVYIDGKLVGALSYRIGQFSKEPIAGITPIEEMLEIDDLDRSRPVVSRRSPSLLPDSGGIEPASARTSVGLPAPDPENFPAIAKAMTPIDAPLVFNGFNEETLRIFAPQFKQAGIMPVMGVGGSGSSAHTPDPVQPGSAVSAVMVRGDMNISGTCTVTYIDDEHLLACGHPLMQFGQVDMPMTKADVVATLSSPLNSFKIVNTGETVGTFVQDRHTGILGGSIPSRR